MLTSKAKYGLKALMHLARIPEGESALIGDIAEAQNIPKKFLEVILLELRKEDFLKSRKGKGGGYQLNMRAKDIMIGQVLRVIDGPLAPIQCASRLSYKPCTDCDDVQGCAIRQLMSEVRDAIANVLDKTNLQDLVERGDRGQPILMYYI